MNEQKQKKVLLLGGTGAMGAHLAKVLAQQGNQVDVTTRSNRNDADRIHYIRGNAHDTSFVSKLLKQGDYDAVVDFMVYDTPEFKARIDMMLGGTRQYVFLSSSRVYADSKTPIKEDETPRLLDVCRDQEYLATDEYALTKARQENILRESGKSNWTIIRPYITYSEIRLQLGPLEKEAWLFRAMTGRTIVFSKDVAQHFTTLTYGFDVARGMAAVIGNNEALGETFHITVGESHTWQELLDMYLCVLQKHLGRKPKVMMLDHADYYLRYPYQRWQVLKDRLYDRRFDSTKISRYVDTASFRPMMEGLQACLEQFLANPKWNYINLKWEAYKDRLTGESAKRTDFPGNSLKSYLKYLIFRYIYPISRL